MRVSGKMEMGKSEGAQEERVQGQVSSRKLAGLQAASVTWWEQIPGFKRRSGLVAEPQK